MGVNNKIESNLITRTNDADMGSFETAKSSDFQDSPPMDEGFAPFVVPDEGDYDDGSANSTSWPVRMANAALICAALAWVAVFGLSKFGVQALPISSFSFANIVSEANAFIGPVALIAVLFLFIRRGSAAESRRFALTTEKIIQAEAQLAATLDARTRQLATEFAALTNMAQQLNEFGTTASERLVDSSAQITTAFDRSSVAAEKMQTVCNAAVGNLDRLQSQMPMMTNAARDLTNAIAEAGGGAATQMRDLSQILTQIDEQNIALSANVRTIHTESESHIRAIAGQFSALNDDFKSQLQDRRTDAEALFGKIGSNMDEAGVRLIAHLAEADVRVSALMQEAQSSARNLAALVTSNTKSASTQTQKMLAMVGNTFADVDKQIEQLLDANHQKAAQQVHDLADNIARLDTMMGQNLTDFAARQNEQIDAMAIAVQATHESLMQNGDALTTLTATQQAELTASLAALNAAIGSVATARKDESHALTAMVKSLNDHVESASTRIQGLTKKGTEQSARLAFAFEASHETYGKLADLMTASDAKIDGLLTMNDRLRDNIAITVEAVQETLPGNLNRFGERLGDVREAIAEQASLTRDLENQGERLVVQFRKLDRLIAEQSAAMGQLNAAGGVGVQARIADSQMLSDLLHDIRASLSELDRAKADELTTMLDSLLARGEQDVADIRTRLADTNFAETISESLANIDIDSMAAQHMSALSERLREQLAQIEAEQVTAFARMEQRLARLTEMSDALDSRVAQTETHFDAPDEEGFARRMALLTESLNSAAIDVAKILSNEVTDTAWQNYLKGDRGVFTRRAVRLLNQQESRVIAQQYDEDSEFRGQVNRYIHDFESMMRVLLSTRDGHVISVTLLSSDVGKLYVALAQAIERLRQ